MFGIIDCIVTGIVVLFISWGVLGYIMAVKDANKKKGKRG